MQSPALNIHGLYGGMTLVWQRYLAPLFAGHDTQNHLIGRAHGILANAGEVAYRAIHVFVDDAFCRRYMLVFHR